MTISSCVTKTIGDNSAEIPPNVQIYYFPRKLVWKNLIQIIRNEFLITFDYASYQKGHFVCKEIRDEEITGIKTKARLSGSMTFDGAGTIVTIYKQIERWDDTQGSWKSVPTDFLLETAILRRLGERLSKYSRKK